VAPYLSLPRLQVEPPNHLARHEALELTAITLTNGSAVL